ncbi:MAG: hypothetical protein ACI7YS_04350 [Flavobacterium sp.]
MKKSFLVIFTGLALMSFVGCSSDSSNADKNSTASNDGYLDVTVGGQHYRDDYKEGYSFSLEGFVDNCDSSGKITGQNAGQIDVANFFMDVYLCHDKNLAEFQNYNKNLAYISSVDINTGSFLEDCRKNFELVISYEDIANNKKYYNLSNSGRLNNITSVSVFKEDSQQKIYVVTGNFSGSFVKSDNSTIPVSGSYKTFISVLK